MAKKKAKKKVKKVRVVDIVKPEQPKGEIMERAAKVVTAIRRASTIDELKGLRVEARGGRRYNDGGQRRCVSHRSVRVHSGEEQAQ